MNVDHEVSLLIAELERFGGRVKFGDLCKDDKIVDTFEALGGTLKAAKKRKLVGFSPESELLLQGAHDHVEIFLIQPAAEKQQPAAAPEPSPEASTGSDKNAPAEQSSAAPTQQAPGAASDEAAVDQSAQREAESAAAATGGNENDM